jgi:integrase/recombinase XerD
MTFNLVCWRKHIGPFRQNTISDLYEGIAKMRSCKVRGHTIKQNTTYDYIRFLKRFYKWMIENEYSTVSAKKIKEIKTPQIDRMTKTTSQMLTEEEISAIPNLNPAICVF